MLTRSGSKRKCDRSESNTSKTDVENIPRKTLQNSDYNYSKNTSSGMTPNNKDKIDIEQFEMMSPQSDNVRGEYFGYIGQDSPRPAFTNGQPFN